MNNEMHDYSELQQVLDDWSSVVPRPLIHDPHGGMLEDAPNLASLLGSPGLELDDVAREPVEIFGVIGEGIIWLTNEEFVWLLPVLVLFGSLSDEYTSLVVNQLRERLPKVQAWPQVKEQMQPETLEWVLALAEKCCLIGWQDERRIKLRMATCQEILGK